MLKKRKLPETQDQALFGRIEPNFVLSTNDENLKRKRQEPSLTFWNDSIESQILLPNFGSPQTTNQINNISITAHCQNGYSFEVNVSGNSTVLQLKKKIFKQEAIPFDAQSIFFGGQFLQNEMTLNEAKLTAQCDVMLSLHKWTDRIQEETEYQPMQI